MTTRKRGTKAHKRPEEANEHNNGLPSPPPPPPQPTRTTSSPSSSSPSSSPRTFAPLILPLHRRVETLCVLVLFLSPLLFLLLNLYCLLLSPPLLFYPYLVYLLYSLLFLSAHVSGRPSLRSASVRSLAIFQHFTRYFPITLSSPAPLPAGAPAIIGYHPHGIISIGAVSAFATDCCGFRAISGGLTPALVTLDLSFRLPFWNLLLLCCGVRSSSKQSLDVMLSRRDTAVVIVLGGAKESLDAFPPSTLPQPETFTPLPSNPILLHMKHRKGFIHLALHHGANLVPAFGFGELSLFSQLANPRGSALRRVQDVLQRWMGFAAPMLWGRGVFQYRWGILPRRERVDVKLGRVIEVERVEEGKVTADMVEALHQRYLNGLVELFEKHKGEYDSTRDATLVFVD